MLQVSLIGHIGGDAQLQSSNGREFTTLRVAHTDKWKDEAGQVHETTIWVDCIINGKPNVFEFLKQGQLVFIQGPASLRVYSSPKDKCMKAGLTINAQKIELLGSKPDDVPGSLINPVDNGVFKVNKWYHCPDVANKVGVEYPVELQSKSGEVFKVEREGWVTKVPKPVNT